MKNIFLKTNIPFTLLLIIVSIIVNFNITVYAANTFNNKTASVQNTPTPKPNKVASRNLIGKSSSVSDETNPILKFLSGISSVGYTPDTKVEPKSDKKDSTKTATQAKPVNKPLQPNTTQQPTTTQQPNATLLLLLGALGSVAFTNSFQTPLSGSKSSQYDVSNTIIWNGYRYYNANASSYEIAEAKRQNGGYEGVVYSSPSKLLYNGQIWIQMEYVGDSNKKQTSSPTQNPSKAESDSTDALAAAFLGSFGGRP